MPVTHETGVRFSERENFYKFFMQYYIKKLDLILLILFLDTLDDPHLSSVFLINRMLNLNLSYKPNLLRVLLFIVNLARLSILFIQCLFLFINAFSKLLFLFLISIFLLFLSTLFLGFSIRACEFINYRRKYFHLALFIFSLLCFRLNLHSILITALDLLSILELLLNWLFPFSYKRLELLFKRSGEDCLDAHVLILYSMFNLNNCLHNTEHAFHVLISLAIGDTVASFVGSYFIYGQIRKIRTLCGSLSSCFLTITFALTMFRTNHTLMIIVISEIFDIVFNGRYVIALDNLTTPFWVKLACLISENNHE